MLQMPCPRSPWPPVHLQRWQTSSGQLAAPSPRPARQAPEFLLFSAWELFLACGRLLHLYPRATCKWEDGLVLLWRGGGGGWKMEWRGLGDKYPWFPTLRGGNAVCRITSSANRDGFSSSFPIYVLFISFSCLLALARTSSTVLNGSEGRRLCLVLGHRKQAFSVSPLSATLADGVS